MHPRAVRDAAVTALRQGLSVSATARLVGVPVRTVSDWKRLPVGSRAAREERCTCSGADRPPMPDPAAYCHLLGLYLGDGCISRAPRKEVYLLRISCCDAWPGLQDECVASMSKVRPDNRIGRVAAPGCTVIGATSKHWPCLFPQHGPGRKHERPIVLADWQAALADAHPEQLLRGLLHSDGCRVTNWTVQWVAGQPKRYEYGRYFFTNESADIRRIATDALDRLAIPWRRSNRNTISVARREGVAALDRFVGPKY